MFNYIQNEHENKTTNYNCNCPKLYYFSCSVYVIYIKTEEDINIISLIFGIILSITTITVIIMSVIYFFKLKKYNIVGNTNLLLSAIFLTLSIFLGLPFLIVSVIASISSIRTLSLYKKNLDNEEMQSNPVITEY